MWAAWRSGWHIKTIQDPEKVGTICMSQSSFNSPVLQIKKPDGFWRRVVNYRELNKLIPLIYAAVFNIALPEPLLQVTGSFHAPADLAKYAFYNLLSCWMPTLVCIYIQNQFAFIWDIWQWTFNVLCQSYLHNLTIYSIWWSSIWPCYPVLPP